MRKCVFFLVFGFALWWKLYAKVNAETLIIPKYIVSSCERWGEEYGISPELLESIAWQETRCRPELYNGSCKGLCEINTYVYKDKIEELGITDIFDADQNIHLCADIIDDLRNDNDDLFYVLQAYNGGNKGISLFNNGTYTSYAKSVSERVYELEKMHGK